MSKQKFIKDPLGQHIRLYAVIYNSVAWRCLSPSAKALWCDLRVQIGSSNNGTASTALGILAHYNWSSRHTVMRARDELIALGLIELTRQGGICSGGKSPNLYRFTDLEMYDIPKKGLIAKKADHLYKKIQTHTEAKKILEDLRTEKKSKVKSLPLVSAVTILRDQKLSELSVH
ncbi:hypothetical protein [Polynucleobacter sp. AP-Reno-20A-A9]|jgi:hypothetical protein|uniref:hypothetical protein n=1 Tax=Polynucleobacter sp. AP-Reno-20A-A9 TaxID=2576925 RepID=UPI001C0D7144|nr:hypothetical protein [Polynucleobacter sp. AP-Reno-20A-A9]MBU3629296.1 hypothetical protein [Polynucleobacter sp. AP-Reno-20A-A9]